LENASSITRDANPLISRFNRETYKLFVQSPKPPQLVANVHEPQEGQATLSIDVIRCRFSQFIENVHDLPVFCALDDIVPAVPGQLGDYNFVHRTRDTRSKLKMLPYWGPGWYWRHECEWMLDVGIVKLDEITHMFTASAHFPADYLKTKLKRLDELWQRSQEGLDDPVESKFALNACFGLWSFFDQYSCKLQSTRDPDDIMAATARRSPAPGSECQDGRYVFHDYITKRKQLTFTSMRPIHQIWLRGERLVMAKMFYILERLQIDGA
jgi:hypothetical protein